MSLMISVITPSFNSGSHLERAIGSVMAQSYRHWEHIVVDGGSTDGTIALLNKYTHLRWISEPDGGQVDAMRKGFAMARGDVLVYLNADDYFFKKAFARAVDTFNPGVMMVVGKVKVEVEKNGDSWVNDPRVDLESMLKHWDMNAYCYNPVGYFIRRELQERIPFNIENPDKHDLEFLLEVAGRFPDAVVKVDTLLGVFRLTAASKTSRDQARLDYWRPENFPFVGRALADASPQFQRVFPSLRNCGYQAQTRWAIHDAIREGRAGVWVRQGRLMSLPVDGAEANGHMAFSEKLNHVADDDAVVCVISAVGDEGNPLAQALRALPDHVSPYPVYHVRLSAVEHPMAPLLQNGESLKDYISCAAFRQAWMRYKDRLRWKFVLPWGDPVARALAAVPASSDDDGPDSRIRSGWKGIEHNLTRVFSRLTSIDLLGADVDVRDDFAVVRAGNVEVLICHHCGSPTAVQQALMEVLGIVSPDGLGISQSMSIQALGGWTEKDTSAEGALRIGPGVLDEVYGAPLVRRLMTSKAIASGRARRLQRDVVAAILAAAPGIHLAPYQLEFVIKILQHTAVAGTRILEIGSDSDLVVGKALLRLGAAQMQCSNMVDFSSGLQDCDDDRISFTHCDGRDLPFDDGSFDLVVGCALLEHVTGVDDFARELHRVTTPGGHVFLHGAPMWPSCAGHHVYFVGKARFYKFTDESNPVPDYGHLTMTPAQLAERVDGPDMPQEDRDRIVNYAYEDDVLNRLHPDAIVTAFGQLFDVVEDFRAPDKPFPHKVKKCILDPVIATGNEVYTLELFLKRPD